MHLGRRWLLAMYVASERAFAECDTLGSSQLHGEI